ncbi:Hypothetical predicted protein, partial [Marmota monax]
MGQAAAPAPLVLQDWTVHRKEARNRPSLCPRSQGHQPQMCCSPASWGPGAAGRAEPQLYGADAPCSQDALSRGVAVLQAALTRRALGPPVKEARLGLALPLPDQLCYPCLHLGQPRAPGPQAESLQGLQGHHSVQGQTVAPGGEGPPQVALRGRAGLRAERP